jgi:hypothetical protein
MGNTISCSGFVLVATSLMPSPLSKPRAVARETTAFLLHEIRLSVGAS